MVWLKIQWKSPTNLTAGLIHLQSCVRPSISFTAHRLPLNAAQMTDGPKCNQITMAGNDKNVKTHVLDRKLAILEQLMPKSWSDFNSCNVSSLKSGIVWSSMGRYKYRPQGDYWGTLCLFFFTPYPFSDIFFQLNGWLSEEKMTNMKSQSDTGLLCLLLLNMVIVLGKDGILNNRSNSSNLNPIQFMCEQFLGLTTQQQVCALSCDQQFKNCSNTYRQ